MNKPIKKENKKQEQYLNSISLTQSEVNTLMKISLEQDEKGMEYSNRSEQTQKKRLEFQKMTQD